MGRMSQVDRSSTCKERTWCVVVQIERSGSSNEGVRQAAVLALLGFMQAIGPRGVLERMQVPGEHDFLGY